MVFVAEAQNSTEKTEKEIVHRPFQESSIEKFRKNPDFNYQKVKKPERPSLWERFWEYIFNQFFTFLRKAVSNESPASRWIVITILAIILVYAVMRLLKADAGGLFYRKNSAIGVLLTSLDENIHALDFEKLIQEALKNKHYSQAIRLFYLKSLKKLEDKSLIDWQIGKTNQEYLQELQHSDKNIPLILEKFRPITLWFEYICYGEFPIELQDFQEAERSFQQFYQQIDSL